MTRLVVAPIVEGHGEDAAVPILLRRLGRELQADFLEVLRPVRVKRYRITTKGELDRAVGYALAKLQDSDVSDAHRFVLVLLDADNDPPCVLGPQLLRQLQQVRFDADVACVLANPEYESWFVAAAESLAKYLDLSGTTVPEAPEEARSGKAWIRSRFRGTRYSETQDQPKMTAEMDLALCRRRSPSFDKLCRELQQRLNRPAVQ